MISMPTNRRFEGTRREVSSFFESIIPARPQSQFVGHFSTTRTSRMGFAVSWLAIRGKEPPVVLGELSLTQTAAREWIPESEVVGCVLPSGWYVIFYNGVDIPSLETAALARISLGAELVTCVLEEHAMVSLASAWRNGTQVWYVVHDSERGLSHLDTEGQLPPGFAGIRDANLAKQKASGGDASNVDYCFDIPVELAQHVCGFRHDDDFDEAETEPFVVLAMDH
jgi:hypothetical protein